MGFDEYLFQGNFVCIEWPERIQELLHENCVHVSITLLDDQKRNISL